MNWENYLSKIKDINVQLPVLMASALALYLERKHDFDFGPFLYLIQVLAIFSLIAVIYISGKYIIVRLLVVKDLVGFKVLAYLKKRSFRRELDERLAGFDIYELYILDLLRRENVIVVKGHRTRNLEARGFVRVIGKNDFRRRLVLAKGAESFMSYPRENFDIACEKSCSRYLMGLSEEELNVIAKLYESGGEGLSKRFRNPRTRENFRHPYYTFLLSLEDSVFLKRTVSSDVFIMSSYAASAYEKSLS